MEREREREARRMYDILENVEKERERGEGENPSASAKEHTLEVICFLLVCLSTLIHV